MEGHRVHVNVHVCVCVCVWVCVCAVEASVMELGMFVMDAPGHRRRFEGLRCLGWQKGASLARLLLSLSLSLSLCFCLHLRISGCRPPDGGDDNVLNSSSKRPP
jgi:hypothetical protein